jgi:hypothetical protein
MELDTYTRFSVEKEFTELTNGKRLCDSDESDDDLE